MHELLKILSDGKFHSGAAIGKKMGLTRAAVWKRMQNMQTRTGYAVESVPGKGYRLGLQAELLDVKRLRALVGEGVDLELLDSVGSTNDYARQEVRRGRELQLVIAEEQTSGKGRRGRDWQSPYGSNLYFSLVWPVTEGMRQLEGLSLAVGLAVLRTIEDLGVTGAGLKWPNDVLVGRKKIAGILLELMGDLADKSYVVIGAGVNVNMVSSVDAISQPWTSIAEQVGRAVSRHEVFELLYGHLQKVLSIQSEQGFEQLRDDWEARHLWHGKKVTISSANTSINGVVTGVNSRGELGIKTGEGVQYFAGGELSLRLSDDS